MSLEKLPPIGGNNKNTFNETTSSPLKIASGKVASLADQLINQLNELAKNETLTPDDIDVQLYAISKKIDRLSDPREQRVVQKLYNTVVYKMMFPIVGELYGRS